MSMGFVFINERVDLFWDVSAYMRNHVRSIQFPANHHY